MAQDPPSPVRSSLCGGLILCCSDRSVGADGGPMSKMRVHSAPALLPVLCSGESSGLQEAQRVTTPCTDGVLVLPAFPQRSLGTGCTGRRRGDPGGGEHQLGGTWERTDVEWWGPWAVSRTSVRLSPWGKHTGPQDVTGRSGPGVRTGGRESARETRGKGGDGRGGRGSWAAVLKPPPGQHLIPHLRGPSASECPVSSHGHHQAPATPQAWG